MAKAEAGGVVAPSWPAWPPPSSWWQPAGGLPGEVLEPLPDLPRQDELAEPPAPGP